MLTTKRQLKKKIILTLPQEFTSELNEKSSNGIPSSIKHRKSKCTQEKSENQIIVTISHHQEYQESRIQNNSSNTTTDSISYIDTDNIASPNKSNLHKWPKDTVLIVGDC